MKPLNILIIDDDYDFAESLGEIFSAKNHKITLNFNPLQGINTFKSHSFDIVFIDMKMPKMNGVDAFLKIKSISPCVKVVLMTGYSVQQQIDTAIENGIFGIINKPLDIEELFSYLEKIQPLIKISEANDKLELNDLHTSNPTYKEYNTPYSTLLN